MQLYRSENIKLCSEEGVLILIAFADSASFWLALQNEKDHYWVGFEVLATMIRIISIFWDITLRSPLKVNRRFGETCRLRLRSPI
jgi:hypothetical protein